LLVSDRKLSKDQIQRMRDLLDAAPQKSRAKTNDKGDTKEK